MRAWTAGAALGTLLFASQVAAAAPKTSIPSGLSLRIVPLIGKVDVRGHYEVKDQAPNTATYLDFRKQLGVTSYGAALRAGWGWDLSKALLTVGLGYTFARAETQLTRTTAQADHVLTLRPAYDAAGLVVDVVSRGGFAGFEMMVGAGRVDPRASGPFDTVLAGERNGYLVGFGIRARFPRDAALAGSVGASYELLGFAPRLLGGDWTNGHLLSLRVGFEFDMALAGASAP